MKLDPVKLVKQRQQLGYSQQNVADKSNVNIRTVQRAEAGVSISNENAASIAAALQTKLHTLQLDVNAAEDAVPSGKTITLRRATSGRTLLDALDETIMGVIECDVEATKENLDLLKTIAHLLETNMRNPLSYEGAKRPSRSLADRLDLVARLNETLHELEECGISVFFAETWLEAYFPEYDHYNEACYPSDETEASGCRAVRIVISDQTSEKVVRPSYAAWPLRVSYEFDEAPF